MSKTLPPRYTGWLTINRACNLRCHWCYAASVNHGKKGQMTLETVERALRLFQSLSVRRVILIGGEPTIHPDFFAIINALKQATLGVMVVTNGVAFADKAFLDEAVASGISGVTTSLKATNQVDYIARTGTDAYTSVIKTIQNLESLKATAGLSHKLSYTVCTTDQADIKRLADSVKEAGSPSLSLDMIRPAIKCSSSTLTGPKPAELATFFPIIHRILERTGIDYSIKVSIPFCLFPEGFIAELVQKQRIVSGCQLLQNGSGVIIDPEGRLLPCNHFCNHPIGLLGGDTGHETYLKLRQKPDVQEFYERITGYPDKRCLQCADWKFCGGGCRVHWLHHAADELLPPDYKRSSGS